MEKSDIEEEGKSVNFAQSPVNSPKLDGNVLPFHQDGRVTSRPDLRKRLIRYTIAILLISAFILYQHHILPCRRAYVASLHPKFLQQCRHLLQPHPTTHTSRLESLSTVLSGPPVTQDESSVYITEPGPSSFYYTGGFSSADWHLSERPFLIAISPSSTSNASRITILTPEFEKLRAQLLHIPKPVRESVTWVSWKEHESPYAVLKQALGDQKAVVLDGHVREFISAGLRNTFGSDSLKRGEGLKSDVGLIRERKDEREIDLLRCANQMTLHAIRKTRSRMRFGITESRTGEILRAEMRAVGLEGGDGLVLFGENAALPHGSGTDRKLCKTDLILIDAGGKWGGYVADITRTFALPKSQISNHHLRIWETVRRAQLAPYTLLLHSDQHASGNLTFGDLDKSARSVISQAHSIHPSSPRDRSDDSSETTNENEPDYSVFTHRLGHGIGLEGHESPYVVQGPLGKSIVQPGHVFSLEPGVYLPRIKGKGEGVGVRLEDCFVVTRGKDGRLGGKWLSGPVRSWGEV